MSFSSRESRPRATSPYRELTKDEAEETPQSLLHYPSTRPELFNLDLCESPGTSQLNSQNRSTLSRKLSTSSKSQYEVALEQAREDSLIDVDDLETQLLPPPSQTNIVVASDRGRSLHPTDAHRRSISIQRGLNGHIQGRPKSPVSAGRNSRGSATDRSKRVCRGCKKPGKDCSFCNVCAVSLCKECWDLQIAHSEDTRAADNVPHEKTDLDIAEKVKACLEPLMTDEQQMSLHRSDENTTWFGVGKNEMEELIFEDCGRYARIMADCPSGRRSSQYPALVSFVGQTGAGKSTLIKMLIELTSNTRQGPVPVVGSVNHSVPTSGDVHLYSDPSTYNSDYPILYADCEGLEGGENEPMAVQARRGDNVAFTLGQGRRTGSFQKRLRKKHHSSQREITWATTPERRSRQYSVTNLYPRLLYTFSDAVVFVLKNARTIENVVEQLIVWASAALEKSTNQPVLPHVIIVLNATENAIDPEQWDIKFATEALMRTVTDAISTNPSFKKYVHFWKDRKKDIHDAHDLLCSYYSSVRVVRIPTKGRPQLISNQLQKLYCQIQDDCMKSREGRRRMRMLLEADELQPYLQYAFDHFSSDLDMPFDFVKASMLNNPIPRDFGGNILKLAINIMDIWHTQLNGIGIFEELSLMVASCIMLDAARHKTKGTAESIFREHYMVHCDDAIEDFCDRHWPCEMICSGGRCNNVKSGHSSKGHQLQNGKAFGSGPYYSKFSAESYGNKWKSKIHHNLQLLLSRLREANDGSESEEVVASRIHQQYVLTPFFKHVKSSENYVSHSTCFCCLIAPPEHPLPCSHVICTPCLQAFGTRKGKFVIELRTCPLWHEQPRIWNKPWQIVSKPPSAGIRILTLDGGGIRGIVELEILRLIQMHLGQTPLQEFFDLIVGTSTGGIIALGIGVEGWSIDRCIEEFSSLCDQAFTPRKGHGIWGLAHMIQGHHGSIYRTQPLQEALRQVFTENSLFGGPRFEANQTSKVAVVTTSAAGLQPIVLSNYNRICGHEEKRSYLFQRPEKPEPELRVWEAARATSAAPTYYKPFPHEPSKQVYIDGGLWHNNPVVIADLERKLIWPDEAHLPPDILLSIGSGCCQNLATPKRSPKTSRKLGIGSNVKALFRIAVDHIESSLDSEKAWRDFAERLSVFPSAERDRYRRFNIELDEAPPKLDDVESMKELRNIVKKQWNWDERISYTAQQLIATSFYFEKAKVESSKDHSFTCTGSIQCRFVPGSQNVRNLGAYLRDCHSDKHSPYFIIEEKYREHFADQVPIGPQVIDEMMRDGKFQMQQLKFVISRYHATSNILLCLKETNWFFPISKFPRTLQQENTQKPIIRQLDSKSTRWRTRSQLHRRGKWSGPMSPAAPAPDDDIISHYSDASYVLGSTSAGNDVLEPVELEDTSGQVELEDTTGQVELEDTTGQVNLEDSSGQLFELSG